MRKNYIVRHGIKYLKGGEAEGVRAGGRGREGRTCPAPWTNLPLHHCGEKLSWLGKVLITEKTGERNLSNYGDGLYFP